jgi:hypothetical protein
MKLPNLKLFTITIFTLGAMTFANAQQAETKPQENSLLESALKKSEESASKSLFYIDKVESNFEAVKKVPSENIKYVMVLTDDKIKKKFKEKGITQVVMVTTKK